MKKIRIISAVLAILLAFSAVSLPVFAADIADISNYPTTEYESMADKLTGYAEFECDNFNLPPTKDCSSALS